MDIWYVQCYPLCIHHISSYIYTSNYIHMLRSTRRHFMLLMANRGLDSSNFLWAMASSSQSLKWLEGKPGKPHDIATWNSHYIHRWIGFIGYPSIAMTKVYERDPYLHAWCIWYTYIYIYICIYIRIYVYVIEYVSLNLLWHPHVFPEPGGGCCRNSPLCAPNRRWEGPKTWKRWNH